MLKRATDLEGIRQALDPHHLTLDQLPEFWQETSDSRDDSSARREKIASILNTTDNVKIVLVGHAGCGKSTELVKFQEEHRSEYVFVLFSVQQEAQLSQLSIEAILVLIIEATIRAVTQNLGVALNEKTIKLIYEWFAEAFQIEEKDLVYGAEAGADVSTKDTFWGKLLGAGGYVKADIKTGSHSLHKAITKENRRLSELARHCNSLIAEAKLAVRERIGREFLLVVEDLDKVVLEAADDIFIKNPEPLAKLACKAIYTAPIWLMANPRAAILDPFYTRVNLPMIKANDREDNPNPLGRKTLVKILEKRMDLSLIDGDENQGALGVALTKTGGVLRHLFDVLVEASEVARQAVNRKKRTDVRILESDVRYALNQLRMDLVRRIGVFGLPPEYKEAGVNEKAMWDVLRDLVKNPRRLDSGLVNLLLLMAHAIIEYNGEGWHRVHPLVQEHLQQSNP